MPLYTCLNCYNNCACELDDCGVCGGPGVSAYDCNVSSNPPGSGNVPPWAWGIEASISPNELCYNFGTFTHSGIDYPHCDCCTYGSCGTSGDNTYERTEDCSGECLYILDPNFGEIIHYRSDIDGDGLWDYHYSPAGNLVADWCSKDVPGQRSGVIICEGDTSANLDCIYCLASTGELAAANSYCMPPGNFIDDNDIEY